MSYARKTKIIATMGPACADRQILRDMVNAGMNVARFNMSHSTHDEHLKRINLVKEVRRELAIPVALMLDTRGPEIRLGKFVGDSVEVKAGSEFRLIGTETEGDSKHASVTCPDFAKMVAPGNVLLMNDGLIKMQVKKIDGDDIVLDVLIGGTLSNHKSINVVGVHLGMPYLSEQDKKDILFGIKQGADYVAASFVSCGDDVRVLKNFLLQNGGENIEIIAKIESGTGIDNIDEIIALADGIMIARGDLGVEIPMEALPSIQKSLIKKARAAGKRVITATEMLESMIYKPRPTRAETSDVANAVYDGTGAVMLSGETAAGNYPVQAVKAMSDIAAYTEQAIHYRKRFAITDYEIESIADAVCASAVKASYDLAAQAIVVATRSGKTAKLISGFRPSCPIIAVTRHESTYHKMALTWGVQPILAADQPEATHAAASQATNIAKYFNLVREILQPRAQRRHHRRRGKHGHRGRQHPHHRQSVNSPKLTISEEEFIPPPFLIRHSSCSEVRKSVRPLTWKYCSPSFPSGFPPPLGKSAVLLKCGICFSFFLIEFESRIEIIERRTE